MAASDCTHHQKIELLYADHHGWLQNWLRRKLGCSHHAADLAQDVFLRIMSSHDALFGIREPRAYLTTTAKRLLADRSRRHALEQAYLEEMAQLAASLPGHPSAEDLLMALQALEQISMALESAPARAREAFLRHYLDEQTQADIALDMNVSKRMVQKYLVQALLHCRAQCPAMLELGA